MTKVRAGLAMLLFVMVTATVASAQKLTTISTRRLTSQNIRRLCG
jgi:hypothetical protein